MASILKNLSTYNDQSIPSASEMRIGIIVSEWNETITQALLKGAYATLLKNGAQQENIYLDYVPGSFELPLGAKFLLEAEDLDAVICLGCVIQGETRHFDFICNAVSNGIMQVSLDSGAPVIFGLLTTNTLQQAKDRSGGKHGNKGDEAAITAIKMIALKNGL